MSATSRFVGVALAGSIAATALWLPSQASAAIQTISCTLPALTSALSTGGDYQFALDSYGGCSISIPAGTTVSVPVGTAVTLHGVTGDNSKVRLVSANGSRGAIGFEVAGSVVLESMTVGGFNVTGANGAAGSYGADGQGGDIGHPNGTDGGDGTPGGDGANVDGGAFHVLASGMLELDSVHLTGNSALAGNPGHAGSGGSGGNAAQGGVGGNGGDGATTGSGGQARGGAIFNEGTVQITDSVVDDNTAKGGGGGSVNVGNGGKGGGTYKDGAAGGTGGDGGTAAIPGNAFGGAIYNAGSLSVSGTDFSYNTAQAGSAYGGIGGFGGSGQGDGSSNWTAFGGRGGDGGAASIPATARGGAVYSETPWIASGGSTTGDVVNSDGTGGGQGGFGGWGTGDVFGATGSTSPRIYGTADHPDFYPDPVAFDVQLHAYDSTGTEINGGLAIGQDVTVKLTVENLTGQDVSDLTWAGGSPITVDDRSTGGVSITGGPDTVPDTIAAGQTQSYSWTTTATANGVAAVETKLTGQTSGGAEVSGQGSLKYVIGDAEQVTKALKNYLRDQVVTELIDETYRNYQTAMINRSNRLATALAKRFSPKEAKQWFGNAAGVIRPTNAEYAEGQLTAVPGEAVAAHLPNAGSFKGYTYDQLKDAYNQAFLAEAKKGVSQWVKGWSDLGASAKRSLEDSWGESIMFQKWMFGTATAEEQQYLVAYFGSLIPGTVKSAQNMYAAAANEITRNAGTDANAAWYAVTHSVEQMRQYKDMLSAWVDKEKTFHADLIAKADTDPIAFQKEWAKHDAEIFNAGFPALAETIIPATAIRVVAAGSKVRLASRGAAVVEEAIDAGVLNSDGQVTAKASKIYHAVDEVTGTVPSDQIRVGTEASMLASRGSLVIESADYGHVYEMPNLGGLPTTTIDAKAEILGSLEDAYTKATGNQVTLAEVLKTSSPLRKEGGVAKLELTAGKSGKPSMLDAGMPDAGLGEANYWHSPTPPDQLPGWDQLGKARQESAVKEWKAANARWADWTNPEPGSKEAKLKEVTGQRGTVPLDDAPNAAGLQRFVNAEFEAVPIKKGKAEGVLIRVKHYEISVVDTTTDTVVDTKTVINNLAKAAPQTADADAVALGKVVGHTSSGEPIIEPLSRSEKEFFLSRYIDANIKARRAGVGTDFAEHGITLNLYDASAKAAGKLVPSFGAPFLPESVGRAFLTRIAPFVKPKGMTTQQMVDKMLAYVEANGGFGSHAVTVTRDGRWLGAVNFASW